MSNYPVNLAPPESEELPVQQKKIRCRQCGRRAYENLVICPHCGRELHPAAPRWLAWGIPAVIVVLFLLVLTGVGGGNPVNGLTTGLERGWSAIAAFGNKIEPRITVGGAPNAEPAPLRNERPTTDAMVVLPAQEEPLANDALANEAAADSVAVVNVAVEGAQDTQPAADGAQPAAQQDAAGEPAVAVDTSTPTPTITPLPTNTPEPPTPVPTATNTPEPSATLEPTAAIATSAPAASATATTEASNSQTSLTVSNIRATSVALTKTVAAASSPTTTPTPLATNTLAPTQTDAAANTPTKPALPTATTAATATFSPTPPPTATATPKSLSYTIQSGDTLLQIANRYDTTVRELMNLNGMSEEDVRRLRVGQEIKLPASPASTNTSGNSAPSPTPSTYVIKSGDLPATIAQQFGITVDALLAANNLSRQDVTRLRIGQVLIIPTGAAATTAAPVANTGSTSGNYRLDAPTLRSPESGTPMSCAARDSLVWNTVPFIAPTDQFVLHLGFVSNVTQNGDQTVTWILELIREQSRTSWDLDSDYCALAPQEWGRQWRWYVQVIDENGNPVSPASETWAFSWN